MAITRSQQAKQMLQDGGMLVKPGFGGTRQGYRGEGGYQGGRKDTAPGAAKSGPVDRGPSGDAGNRFTQFTKDVLNPQVDTVTQKFTGRSNLFGGANRFGYTDLRPDGSLIPGFGGRVFGGLVSLLTGIPFVGGAIGSAYDKGKGFFAPKVKDMSEFNKLGLYTDQFSTEDDDDDTANTGTTTGEIKDTFLNNAMAGLTKKQKQMLAGPQKNLKNILGISDEEILKNISPFNDPNDPATLEEVRNFYTAADGGIMNPNIIGGKMDFESARQMYGLGKLVKKVTRTVKKIAKSPIGKAAIVGAGFGLAGMGPFKALQGSGFSKFLFGLPSGRDIVAPTKGLFGVGGKLALGKGKLGIGTLIAGTSLLAGLMTPKQEEEAQELARGEGIDIEAARRSILARAQGNVAGDLRATAFLAEGGKPEPVAKKTMPLLDMGGQEMDLRAEGGFVPIGRMEKADDVPARLSKNEFVFTADAVRNAGDGDVDKGAEVMYNMMKNLEAGGEVSEESQGLEGARKMFQTSQRLEEVL